MANPIKLRATVSRIQDFGEGVYRVVLDPERRPPSFKAGQFLHLSIDDYDPAGGFWPESRVFSIASQSGAEELEIVYSVKGRYTGLMRDALRPGRQVWLKLPYGDFVIASSLKAGGDAVLIAGGTGISPFVPYVRARGTASSPVGGIAVRMYYGIRLNRHLLYPELWDECAQNGSVDVRLYVECEVPVARPGSNVRISAGRLEAGKIIEESEDLRNPVFFISGPPAMISAFSDRLIGSGVDGARIVSDKWE